MNDLPNSWAATHGSLAGWLLPFVVSAMLLARRLVPTRLHRWYLMALGVCALISAANGIDYGLFRYNTYLNEWDTYHYYVGTKYIRELGYTGIYEATLVADAETGLRYHNPEHHIRDLSTYDPVPVDQVFARSAIIRGRFTPARWREFVGDIAWYKMQLPAHRWSLILDDHGFNGTPPWLSVVELFTGNLPITQAWSRWALILLDPLLLAVMLAAVAVAYDLEAALVLVVLLGTHYFLSWGHLKGGILRLDFAVCSVLSACALKRERYATAGALLGWATIARAFPGAFVIGPAAILFGRLVRDRTLDRSLARFVGAFTLTVSLLLAFALWRHQGPQIFFEWARKIRLHALEGSHWNIGLSTLFDVDFVGDVPIPLNAVRMFREEPSVLLLRGIQLWGVRAAVLVPTFYFMRWMRPHDALSAGFVTMFFLVSPDYYYFVVLALPLVFFAGRPAGLSRALGLSWMLVTGALGYLFFMGFRPLRGVHDVFVPHHQEFPTSFYSSWCVALTALHIVAVTALEGRAAAARAAASNQPITTGP